MSSDIYILLFICYKNIPRGCTHHPVEGLVYGIEWNHTELCALPAIYNIICLTGTSTFKIIYVQLFYIKIVIVLNAKLTATALTAFDNKINPFSQILKNYAFFSWTMRFICFFIKNGFAFELCVT